MLSKQSFRRGAHSRAQHGVVLLVALIVLVAISVAGMAMMRSVDTSTLVAGNLAFRQAATHAGDKGVERALEVLRQKATAADLNNDSNGYFSHLTVTDNPAAGVSWQEFWHKELAANAYSVGKDQFDNDISFVIHRQCTADGSGAWHCVASPAVTKATGNSEEANEVQLHAASQVYYRITVRVQGPRRTESYVQTHVAM